MVRPASGAGQLGLDMGVSSEVHRLFFALWPNAAMRQQFALIADRLRASGALSGDWLEPAKYHATLHFLGDSSALRGDVVEAAQRAAGRIEPGGGSWALDRIDSFHGRRPPCILRSAADPPALRALWQSLREALILEGVGKPLGAPAFTPHVTLAYASRPLAAPIPLEPLLWQVDRLALIHSSDAFKGYRVLAEWPLQ